jgi:hypothetical protein
MMSCCRDVVVNMPTTIAGTELSGGNTRTRISQSVGTGAANAATTTARYDYQYGSAGGLIEPLEVDWI